jgi:DNA transposition AAA+ family ATPase
MMTVDERKRIMDALEAYMSEHGVTQNRVIERSGVNSNYITEMRRGRYVVVTGGKEVAIADKYFEKIADMVGVSVKKTYWRMQHTAQLREALSILEDARRFGYTSAVIGETGCGKSYALDLFARKYPNDVFVVTVSQLDNIGDLLEKILERLKIAPARTKSRKLKDIAARLLSLKADGRNPVLVFDESEYMKQAALCGIKELYDSLNRRCGIVMAGHYQLVNNINRLRRRNRDGIPQFYRRIKFGIRYLSEIDRATGFDLFLSGIEDVDLRRFLYENCENYGELHDVLVPALREADRTGERVTENFVRKVLNLPVNIS